MITLNKLVVGYDKPLTKPMDLKFDDGKIYGILGKSGCGKSTLLKTIASMIKPISGEVVNQNTNQIYMMHQRYTNFNWLSCLDNVLIAERKKRKRKELRPRAVDVLNKVGLGEYLDRYPTELSGGMQQRLALARVLFVKPSILLMDEPLSALDDSTRAKMQQLIMDIHKETGNTIIMVTHSIAEAEKMCDQIIKLDSEVLK
jgi:ABC-type nitrate/sulfonate/bicarbonate transport system ATPase subunit